MSVEDYINVDRTEYKQTLWSAFSELETVELGCFEVHFSHPNQMSVLHPDASTGRFTYFNMDLVSEDSVADSFERAAKQLLEVADGPTMAEQIDRAYSAE